MFRQEFCRYMESAKPQNGENIPNPELRLREQFLEMRFHHYSTRTEESALAMGSVHFISSQKRHPREMGRVWLDDAR